MEKTYGRRPGLPAIDIAESSEQLQHLKQLQLARTQARHDATHGPAAVKQVIPTGCVRTRCRSVG